MHNNRQQRQKIDLHAKKSFKNKSTPGPMCYFDNNIFGLYLFNTAMGTFLRFVGKMFSGGHILLPVVRTTKTVPLRLPHF